METGRSTADQRAQDEQDQVSARGMRFLTGGLTEEGDAFLIGALAVFLMGALYPLIDAWSMLAFPFVFVVAVLVRRRRAATRTR